MRVFTAVRPSEEAIEHLDAFLEPRRGAAPYRWTRPEQLHVTLAFMGDAANSRIDDYVDRLAESLDGLDAIDLTLAGTLVFPHVAQGRVLATGIGGAAGDLATLASLATRTRNAAVNSGLEVDGQSFRPHVTIARTRGPLVDMTNWVRLLDTYTGPPWTCAGVEVIASHLGEGPRRTPRHETLAEIVL